MTQPCYGPDYPEAFKRAVEGLAHKEKDLLALLELGPNTISRLEYNLRVVPSDRLNVLFSYRTALSQAITNPDIALKAAEALTADLAYLDRKSAVHKACLDICPPKYRPTRG